MFDMAALRSTTLSLSLSALVVAWPASALTAQTNYFRSDEGVARTSGPMPSNLTAPEALVWRVPLDGGHSSPILKILGGATKICEPSVRGL